MGDFTLFQDIAINVIFASIHNYMMKMAIMVKVFHPSRGVQIHVVRVIIINLNIFAAFFDFEVYRYIVLDNTCVVSRKNFLKLLL